MSQELEITIPTPSCVRKRLEVDWSAEASQLLRTCINALSTSGHVGATVRLPEGTGNEVVTRVCQALEKKGWHVTRDSSGDQRTGESWDNLHISVPVHHRTLRSTLR